MLTRYAVLRVARQLGKRAPVYLAVRINVAHPVRDAPSPQARHNRKRLWPETQAMASLDPHRNLDGTGGKIAIPSRPER
jgi:hypothetical protein